MKRKPLKAKTLKAKTTLKAKKPLKAVSKPKKRKTLEQKTAQELIKEADKWFSRYIRLRDSKYVDGDWLAACICCGEEVLVLSGDKWGRACDNGHFLSRGMHQLRYNEFNCNAQKSFCNVWKDKETMQEGYRSGIVAKYGKDTLLELKEAAKAPGVRKRLPKQELLQIITDAKEYIKHCQTFPQNYSR